jgi:hypothetical protein
VQSCFPSRDMVLEIDQCFYPMGAWDPFLPPLDLSDLDFPFESDLVVCISSRPYACDSSLIDSTSLGQNFHRHMEYGHFYLPFGTIDHPHSRDF